MKHNFVKYTEVRRALVPVPLARALRQKLARRAWALRPEPARALQGLAQSPRTGAGP